MAIVHPTLSHASNTFSARDIMENHGKIKEPSATSGPEPAFAVWFDLPATKPATEKVLGISRAEASPRRKMCSVIAPVRSYRRELMAVLMWFVVSLGTAGHPHGKDTCAPETEDQAVCFAQAPAPERPKAAPTCDCLKEAAAAAPPASVEPVAPAGPAIVAETSPSKGSARASRRKPRAKSSDDLQLAAKRLLRERVQPACGARLPAGETRTVVVTLTVNFIERSVVGASLVARKPGAVERCVLDEVNAKISRGWGTFQVKPTHRVRYRLRGRPHAT